MKQNYKKLKKIISLIMCIIVLFSCTRLERPYEGKKLMSNLNVANDNVYATGVSQNIIIPEKNDVNDIDSIAAESYFIASTNRFKSSFTRFRNPYEKLAMASLTKLMTALIVLKNCKDLNEEYYVTTDAVDLEKDASTANLKAGDKLKVMDLLYGLLLPSGNDAAICLAENLVDSYDNFIIMMNNEAERLGALNTHFDNPHGFDSVYHYTTAYDLFLITRELIKYPLFREISISKEHSAKIIQSDGEVRTEKWLNTNYFVTEEMLLSSKVTLLGGKTGNTTNAGNCLVLLSKDKKDGNEYISVVLNAKSKRNVYTNSNTLFNLIK